MKKKRPILNVMVGHSGSGKSYFARQLAAEKQWTRLNGDSMRMALFGSVKELEKHDISFRREGIFRAVDYAAEQVLMSGQPVVYDANNNKREIRKAKEDMAARCNALAVVVWVQTPKHIAIERTQHRTEAVDQRKFNALKAKEVVERHISNLDEPNVDEQVILIDGTAQFTEQLKAYETQLRKIINEQAA